MLNTSTNVFCQYCPRREGLRRRPVLRSICKAPGRSPPPRWTGRGQVNEGVMFSELRVLLFVCFRSVHGWMGMHVLSECLYDTILVRRLCTMEKDVLGLTCNIRDDDIIRHHMLEYLLNTLTNVFCQYCPRRQGLRSEAALRSICQAS